LRETIIIIWSSMDEMKKTILDYVRREYIEDGTTAK